MNNSASRFFLAGAALCTMGAFAADPLSSEPCTPFNRCTIEGAIPVVNMLYREDYNMLHGGERKSFDLVTIGDSITCNWSVRDADGYNSLGSTGYGSVLNLGIGGDRTQHVLWRLEEGGCLENFTTKYFTLMIGVNNTYQTRIESGKPCDRAEDVAAGIKRILADLTTKHPEAKILLMPILPYANKLNRHDVDVFRTDEDINDITIGFVDNKRIFWLDLRGQMLNADGTLKDELYSAGSFPGSDGVGHYLHPSGKAYKTVFNPAVKAAMAKYAAVAAGTAQATDPSIGFASAAVNGASSKVDMTLSGVYLGTDASARPAKSYAISYRLDGGDWVTAVKGQTLTRNTFVVPEVSVGKHVCEIKVTTDANKSVTTVSEFTMCDPWVAEPLTASATSIRTDGKLAYAYAGRDVTVNGVPFKKLTAADNEDLKWDLIMGFTSVHPVAAETEKGGYHDLISAGWWFPNSRKSCSLELKNLKPGAKYLVQIIANRSANNDGRIWIEGTHKDSTYILAGGDGWKFGGSLTGTVKADAEGRKSIQINSDGGWALNAVQVREL